MDKRSPIDKPGALRNLRQIPGVGFSIAEDLWDLGIRHPRDLSGSDPQVLYDRLCQIRNMRLDRCLLYVFRCAVYYASAQNPEKELLKWWNWKDRN